MIKTGSIIAIIAGLFGLLAGFVTLFLGGLGSAFSASGAGNIVSFGWGGILFSLLVVIYGAIAISKPKPGATGLILSSILGIVLGGTLVAILMLLALAGGIMAAVGKSQDILPSSQRRWPGMLVAAIAPILCAVYIGVKLAGPGSAPSNTASASSQTLQVGQTARSDKFEVTVRSVRFSDFVGQGLMVTHADPGTTFAIIEVSARCIDKESRFYAGGDLYAKVNGTLLKYDHSELILGLDSPMGQINPLTEKIGFAVYKIPVAAAGLPLFWSPGNDFPDVRFALMAQSPAQASTPSVTPDVPVPSPAPAVAPTANISVGRYANGNAGTLTINQLVDGGLGFSLEVVSEQGNSGEAEGALTPNGEAYVYKNTEMDCLLTLRPAENNISIMQQGICGFGMNVDATGVYRKLP